MPVFLSLCLTHPGGLSTSAIDSGLCFLCFQSLNLRHEQGSQDRGNAADGDGGEFPPGASVKNSPGLGSKEERGAKKGKPNFGGRGYPVRPKRKRMKDAPTVLHIVLNVGSG